MEFVKGRVLDVGCGAGRCSLYLQRKGFDVIGIDNSPLAIKVCKLRGLKKAKLVAIEDAKFGPNSFDTILMMETTLAYSAVSKKPRDYYKEILSNDF